VNSALRHPLRVVVRLVWLASELVWIGINFVPRVQWRSRVCRNEARKRWCQWACRRINRIFNLQIWFRGDIPSEGLLVSNHLGYLDILVLGALSPAVFVAKREVREWPIFGWLARFAGTLFVERDRRLQVGQVAKSMAAVLHQENLVVLFPEGTSSDGRTVLPFKSALLEPVTNSNHKIWVSALGYELSDGDVANELCYWRDMTFLPHLFNLLGKQKIAAFVEFGEFGQSTKCRKLLARQLHDAVCSLRQAAIHPTECLNASAM
jgi:1-acyl-sn-glycerol-3-phosphate acyltransferase